MTTPKYGFGAAIGGLNLYKEANIASAITGAASKLFSSAKPALSAAGSFMSKNRTLTGAVGGAVIGGATASDGNRLSGAAVGSLGGAALGRSLKGVSFGKGAQSQVFNSQPVSGTFRGIGTGSGLYSNITGRRV